jgi:hypothetical protein
MSTISAIVGDTSGLAGGDASDIASAVWAHLVGTRVDSRLLLVQSQTHAASNMLSNLSGVVSNVYSMLVAHSTVLSATFELLSDVDSALTSQFGVTSNALSNLSAMVSDVDSALTSQFAYTSGALSDIRSDVSDMHSDLLVMSNVLSQVLGDTTALDGLGSVLDATYSQTVGLSAVLSDLSIQITTGVALTTAGANAVADAVLDRNLAGGGSGSSRSVRNALRALRNRTGIVAGIVRVYTEDDTTTAWSGVVSTFAGDPIVGIDPS